MVNSILFILWLAGAVFAVTIFIYSLIFLISVPKNLKRISDAVERIACSLEKKAYNKDNNGDQW